MLMLLALMSLFATKESEAGYVDVGWQKQEKIEALFHADNFIVSANSDRVFGLGIGKQHNNIEMYFGVGNKYIFSEIIYKNERHSIYDLGVEYINERYQARIAYTHLFSDTFGIVTKYNFKTRQAFVGFRKWAS